MSKDELIQELASLVIGDPKISSKPWEQLAIVARLNEGHREAYGFAYLQDGTASPTAPRNFDFLRKVAELQKQMIEPGKEPWKAILIRMDKASGKFTVDFEYDQPEKWYAPRGNAMQLAEQLRPPRQ